MEMIHKSRLWMPVSTVPACIHMEFARKNKIRRYMEKTASMDNKRKIRYRNIAQAIPHKISAICRSQNGFNPGFRRSPSLATKENVGVIKRWLGLTAVDLDCANAISTALSPVMNWDGIVII